MNGPVKFDAHSLQPPAGPQKIAGAGIGQRDVIHANLDGCVNTSGFEQLEIGEGEVMIFVLMGEERKCRSPIHYVCLKDDGINW